jgi:hypothetical protein
VTEWQKLQACNRKRHLAEMVEKASIPFLLSFYIRNMIGHLILFLIACWESAWSFCFVHLAHSCSYTCPQVWQNLSTGLCCGLEHFLSSLPENVGKHPPLHLGHLMLELPMGEGREVYQLVCWVVKSTSGEGLESRSRKADGSKSGAITYYHCCVYWCQGSPGSPYCPSCLTPICAILTAPLAFHMATV